MNTKLNVVSYTFAVVAGVSLVCGLALLSGEVRV